MIPNAAQNSFWLFRYLERSEMTAQMLLSARLFKLEDHLLCAQEEDVLLTLSPERTIFAQLYPQKSNDDELVQHFLTWQEVNPSCLLNTFKSAREAGKLVRNVIGKSIWNVINELYLWLLQPGAKKLYTSNCQLFYQRFLQTSQLLKGGFYNALSRDLYYHMMELGMRLERAYQAMRNLICLKTHALLIEDGYRFEQEYEVVRFLLECNASTDAYLKTEGTFNIEACANFFLFEETSPRSLKYSIDSMSSAVSAMQALPQLAEALEKCNQTLDVLSDGDIFSTSLQGAMLSALNEVSSAIENVFCRSLSALKG